MGLKEHIKVESFNTILMWEAGPKSPLGSLDHHAQKQCWLSS